MELITNKDMKLIKENLDNINKSIKKKIIDIFEPTIIDRKKIYDFIKSYIKENERKIYGGFALNELIKLKNKKDKIYDFDDLPDIDFYSYDPNSDIINICNKIYDMGFKKVNGREAKHKNTYSIFVNYELYCDITYVPKYIYDKIPIKIIENYKYVHPNFIMLDYLKILTDPICSNWRIEKSLNRLNLLNKHYPIQINNNNIIINQTNNDSLIINGIKHILYFIKNIPEVIVVGFYAYNYFLIKSEYGEIDLLDIPFIEIISKNYIDDCNNILNLLKDKITNKISYKEYYPFFTYTGHICEIYLEEELICIIYDYNEKCVPYQTVNYINYINYINYNDDIEYTEDKINIGTFSLTLLYGYINIFRNKVFNFKEMKDIYEKFVSHLLMMRQYYFDTKKETILSNNIFKEFITDCIYPNYNPEYENLIRYEKRRLNNKPSMYIYDPEKNKKEEKDKNFYFANISGNEIKNNKHSKLNNSDKNYIDIDDIDDIDDVED